MVPSEVQNRYNFRRPSLSLPLSLESWLKNWYPWIVNFLNLSTEKDLTAIDEFTKIIHKEDNQTLSHLKNLINGRPVIIFGCGPSLEDDLHILLEKKPLLEKSVLITADGATRPLLDNGLLPDIIVTDADGDQQSIVAANKQKSIIVCHLHGDNHQALLTLVPRLIPSLTIFSVQTEPIGYFHNFLGFTDGDRAAFLAAQFGCSGICLLGFDLGKYIGKYSKPNLKAPQLASSFKRRKLIIARELLSWLATQTTIPIINSSAQSEAIPLVKAIPLHKLTSFPY
ncbi:MAG: 6-hydroxymethylpterin diphosphokinase MptE-like protein [Candidatus Hermodarchaeota archaeon]